MEPAPFLTERKTYGVQTYARAFTLIEMLVVTAIIILITGVVLVSQNSFNRATILTDTSYTMALSIRDTQSLGLASRAYTYAGEETAYGVYFGSPGNANPNNQYLTFADTESGATAPNWCNQGAAGTPAQKAGNCLYDSAQDAVIQQYTLNQGYTISNICGYDSSDTIIGCETGTGTKIKSLAIVFSRPNTDTTMTAIMNSGNYKHVYDACITISSPDATTYRYVEVTALGEVSSVPYCPSS